MKSGTAQLPDRGRFRIRPLVLLLALQVTLGVALLAWVVGGQPVPFVGGGQPAQSSSTALAPKPSVDRFDEDRAWRLLVRQVEVYGPRPAGSQASRRLAEDLRRRLPRGRLEPIGGGLRNVVGELPGRRPHLLVGAHYDTEAVVDGHVGANDGAAGTAAVVELARVLARADRPAGAPAIRFVLFDGEEEPLGSEDQPFEEVGLRGSKFEAAKDPKPRAMILLDYIAEKRGLRIPREAGSDREIWRQLRASARRVGTSSVFPNATGPGIIDDHVPFLQEGVPAIDLIDFDYPERDTRQDDLRRVSKRSLDAVGETVADLLLRWR